MESVAPTVTTEAKADRFVSFAALMEAHSELLQREPVFDESSNYLSGVKQFFDRAQATGAILDDYEERRTTQTILNYWVTVLYRAEADKPQITTLADYDPTSTVEFDATHCPYPGVRAFREDESRLFFGRQRQINYLLARLGEERLLMISGPSGSGKTSLVMAGLLPEMKQQDKLSNTERYYFPVITPGSRPLENLNQFFATTSEQTNASVRTSAEVTGLSTDRGQEYRQLLLRIQQTTSLPAVLVIDQFEQVFTRASDRDRYAFIRSLHRVIRSRQANHIVILISRSDDSDRSLSVFERKVLEPARVSLGSLGSIELRDAIEKPAAFVGVKFPPSLVETLVKEIVSEPVGLPLLQFALTRIWTTLSQTHSMEGAQKILPARTLLAQSAENVFKNMNARDLLIADRSLGRLIKINKDLSPYSCPAARSDLYLRTEKNARVDNLIERLAGEQLLRIHRAAVPADDEIELVHDSLLRTWPRMVAWVTRKTRRRWFNKVAAAVLLAIPAVILLLLLGYLEGKREQGVQSRELAALSAKQFSYGRLDLALLFGREAYRVEHNSITTSNALRLLYALQSTTSPRAFLYRQGFQALDTAFSVEKTGAQRLAAVDYDGNVVIWNLKTQQVERTLMSNDATSPLSFSPDGKKLVASAKAHAGLILWDLDTGARADISLSNKETPDPPVIQSLAFTPDATNLITGDSDGRVLEWDVGNPINPKTIYRYDWAVSSLAVNDKFIASGAEDGKIVLLPRGNKKAAPIVLQPSKSADNSNSDRQIVSLAFAEEHPWLAVGSARDVFVWDFEKRQPKENFCPGPLSRGLLVSFTNQDQFLSAFGFDGSLMVWDMDAGAPVGRQFYDPRASVSANFATFSSSGDFLALPSPDGVQVWKTTDRTVTAGDAVSVVAFNPRTRILSAGLGGGAVVSWRVSNTESHEPDKSIDPDQRSKVQSIAFAEDGSLMAIGFEDGTINLRNTNDYAVTKTLNGQTGAIRNGPVAVSATAEGTSPGYTTGDPVRVAKIAFDQKPGSRRLAALIETQESEDSSKRTASHDKTAGTRTIIWDTSNDSKTPVPVDPSMTVKSIAFASDGALALGAVSADKSYKVILSRQGQQIVLPCQSPCQSTPLSLAFNHKAQILAAGFDDGKVVLWDLPTNTRISDDAMGSAAPVTDLTFNPDDTLLAVVTNEKQAPQSPLLSSQDSPAGKITLLEVETRSPVGSLLVGHKGKVSSVAFSPDGKMLASASSDYKIILWDLNLNDVDSKFCEIAGCSTESFQRAIVSNSIKKPTRFQSLYCRISRWLGDSCPGG
jgi:WD40 repeat protein